jgi:hypothetical protein
METWALLSQILAQEPILQNLSRHQQELDRFDIEKVYSLYLELEHEVNDLHVNLSPEKWMSIISLYLGRNDPGRFKNIQLIPYCGSITLLLASIRAYTEIQGRDYTDAL